MICPPAGVLQQVLGGFGNYQRYIPGRHFIKCEPGGEPLSDAPHPRGIRLFLYSNAGVYQETAPDEDYFQRVIVTRVPSPTLESRSNSLQSRFAPLKPRPRPVPVE